MPALKNPLFFRGLVMLCLLGYTHPAPADAPPTTAPTTPPTTQVSTFHKTISKSIGYDYAIQFPHDYDNQSTHNKKYPLLIFLHGSGSCGGETSKLLNASIFKVCAQRQDSPFVIVAPHLPDYSGWWNVESLDVVLDHVLETCDIDPDRVYLTGASLGAYGVWDWACHRPNAFAAISPCAGEGNDDWAAKLKNVPVWAFHGDRDQAVALAEEQRMVNAVNKAGGSAKLTIYPNTGHNAWEQAYRDPALFDWFLSHTRHQ
jgi:predicted peptidase